MHKAIIFDFDGVITDGIPFQDQAYLKVFKIYGLNVSLEYLHANIGLTPREVFNIILQKHNITFDINEVVKQHHDEVFKLYQSKAVPSPNLNEFLNRCQQAGLVIGLASSTHSDILNMVLDKFGIKKYFSAIIGGETVAKGKPDPDMLRQALAKLDIDPHDAMAIDDAQSGIDAAKSLNMYTIAYTRYSHQAPVNADVTVKDFLEVESCMP